MADGLKAVFLVDGEHHPATVLAALRTLSEREGLVPVGLFFLGGTEKIVDVGELSSPRYELFVAEDPARDLGEFLRRLRPRVVVDLSDLPVLGPRLRMELAAVALAEGACYRGGDFEFRPPVREEVLSKPSCAVIGTGKRCGKTAVSAEMARFLHRAGLRPVVVAMGRGGPPEPYLVREGIDGDFLLGELDKGLHAASDHYEDALISGVVTVGSRRCGGGMAGQPYVTNCAQAARLAETLPADAVIVEGSGSSIPPVAARVTVCVVSAAQDMEEALGYLGPYRLLISDGVVITMCEEPFASPRRIKELRDRIKRIKGDIITIETVFRPHPLQPISGRKVFLAMTAPEAVTGLARRHLEEETGCRVVGMSSRLAERKALLRDLEGAGEAEVILTELKAAAVEVAARYARERGKEIVYFHNLPVPSGGAGELEGFFRTMWEKATERS
ncbi:MAG: 2,3-diphosphoglycerate synthetase [Actinobacteria bacterium]|nr:2,3-diphosphoglycerate synthetase [Actinomycetota bacterium]